MDKDYKTLNKQGYAELEEKKSKFISNTLPIQTEDEAIDFINQIKKEHRNAVHNVFAYQVGNANEIQRCSDDGEPSGTAGLPVLDVLRKENIQNAVIVVTRYFGGILLGTGGLVRAYSKCAKLGVDDSVVITLSMYDTISLTCNYETSGKILYYLNDNELCIQDTIYTENVTYIFYSKSSNTQSIKDDLKELSNGTVTPTIIHSAYGTIVNNQFEER